MDKYEKYEKLCDEVFANSGGIFYNKEAHIDRTVMEEEFEKTGDKKHISIKNKSFLTWIPIKLKENLKEIEAILKKNKKNYDITARSSLKNTIESLNTEDKNKCLKLIEDVLILESDKYGIKKYRKYI